MKIKYFFCLLSITFMLAGCASISSVPDEDIGNTWEETGSITVGRHLTITNNNSGLVLINHKDVLASDGLYYASWVIGDARPYENSDGDTIDLYDAQLYLLLGEFSNNEQAISNMASWLETGKTNYEVISEKEIICNGQTYTLIIYNCINENNPYDRGASALGVHGKTAVCIELTCIEDFEGEPETILTDFLNNCTYNAD